jgi:dihydrodipicolinate synthase/N-acetylneuraminate lyase
MVKVSRQNIISLLIFSLSIFCSCALNAKSIPLAQDMRGPFPIMSTPYFEDGSVDYESLGKEALWVAQSGCPGVIWCQSNDAIDLLSNEEKIKGFEACAAALAGVECILTLGANGTNTAEMIFIASKIEEVAKRHPKTKIAMISRPPDDVRSQEDLEAAWDALGKVSRRPVIFQTYGTASTPTPNVDLIVRLAKRHPHAFGYVKEEAAGWSANERMLKERMEKNAIKTIFAGWGGWQWLLQLRHCGCEGLVTERCAYAPILAEIWRRYERGERGSSLTEAYAMYRLLIDQRNFPGGLRGYSLYILNKIGVFRSMVSREYEKAKVTEGGSFGTEKKWKLTKTKLNDIQKKELDCLFDDMMDFVNKGRMVSK